MPNIDERVKRIPEFHSGSIKRCPHDIYMPDADAPTGKSWGCTACFPADIQKRPRFLFCRALAPMF